MEEKAPYTNNARFFGKILIRVVATNICMNTLSLSGRLELYIKLLFLRRSWFMYCHKAFACPWRVLITFILTACQSYPLGISIFSNMPSHWTLHFSHLCHPEFIVVPYLLKKAFLGTCSSNELGNIARVLLPLLSPRPLQLLLSRAFLGTCSTNNMKI